MTTPLEIARPLLLIVLLSLCGTLGLRAQETAPPSGPVEPPPVFGEVVDVRVVEVEVVVTRDGEPVTGLDRERFALEVDGRSTPVDYFREVRDGREAPAAPGSGRASTGRTGADGGVVGTRYLVFIDDYFAMRDDRDRVLDGLEEQLDRLRPEDRMAIVAWEGRRVELLTGWTASRPILRRALDTARSRPAYGLQRRSEARQVEALLRYRQRSSAGRSITSIGFNGSRGASRAGADTLGVETLGELRTRLRRLASAVSATLRGFGSPPERDVLLFLSGGLPDTAADAFEVVRGLELRGDVPDPWDSAELMSSVVTTANRLGWTVYPVALDRQEARDLADASISTAEGADFARRRAGARVDLLTDNLRQVASATGGVAILGAASPRALSLAVDDTRSYYVLGFSPTWKFDDSEHSLEIRVRAPDGRPLQVRTREGFSDLSATTRISMQAESAHLFDAPLEGGDLLTVEVGESESAGLRRMRVPIRMFVPLDRIRTTVAGDGTWSSRLALQIFGTDERGDSIEISMDEIELQGRERPRARQFAALDTRLELRRRPHRLFLALHDPASGELLGARIEVEP